MADRRREKIQLAQEHALKILNRLHHLRKLKTMCDAVLSVEGKHFPVHKIVVSASSPYFQVLFSGGMKESFTETVSIQGIDSETFSSLLDFIYTGYIDVSEDNVQQLLPAAKMLQLDSVEERCCHFLNHQLDSSNCLGIFQFAEVHSCSDLIRDALEFIHRNFLSVCKNEEYFELNKMYLLQLLSSEELKIESECQVFEAAMNWVLHDVPNRREGLGQILERIRLPLISSEYFEKYLSECKNPSLSRMLDNILSGYRSYQFLARSTVKLNIQPRKASRKCFYIVGGYSRSPGGRWSDTASLTNVEKFDSFTQCCDSYFTAVMSYPRSGHAVAALSGMVYAIGGENDSLIYDTTERFDPALNSWSLVAPLNAPRVACGACVVDEYIYVIGGWVGSVIADDIERYDPKENRWDIVGRVEFKRFQLGVTELNGDIFVIGGLSELAEDLKRVECYNPVQDKWTRLADMNTRRAYLGVASLNNAVYAVGGSNEDDDALASVERYNSISKEWTFITALESPRAGPSVAVNCNMLYVIGGRSSSGEFSPPVTMTNIDMYDPQTNKWSAVSHLAISRCEFGVGVL